GRCRVRGRVAHRERGDVCSRRREYEAWVWTKEAPWTPVHEGPGVVHDLDVVRRSGSVEGHRRVFVYREVGAGARHGRGRVRDGLHEDRGLGVLARGVAEL